METLFAEISDVLDNIEQKSNFLGCQSSDSSELLNHVLELKDQLKKERNDYNVSVQHHLFDYYDEFFYLCNFG